MGLIMTDKRTDVDVSVKIKIQLHWQYPPKDINEETLRIGAQNKINALVAPYNQELRTKVKNTLNIA